ncbi:hypothetical protein D9M70_449520 [compost metagenome]
MWQRRVGDELVRLQAVDRFMDQLVARVEQGNVVGHGDLLAEPGAGNDTGIHLIGLVPGQPLAMKRIGLGRHQGAVAGHQPEDRREGREGAAADGNAGFFKPPDGILERLDDFRLRIVEDHRFRDHQRDAGKIGAAHGRGRQPVHGSVHPDCVLHRVAKGAKRIQAFSQRKDALHRVAAACCLVADDAGHRRGNAHGPAGIGADGCWHQPGRDRDRRA